MAICLSRQRIEGRTSFTLNCAALLPVSTAQAAEPSTVQSVTFSASELFAFADKARDAGGFATAETAYRALAESPDRQLRAEARFRLALMQPIIFTLDLLPLGEESRPFSAAF